MSDFFLVRDGEIAIKKCDREWWPWAPIEFDHTGFYTPYGFIIPNVLQGHLVLSMLTRVKSFGIPYEDHRAPCYMIDHRGRLMTTGFRQKGTKITETPGNEMLPVKLFARGGDKDESEMLHYILTRTASMSESLAVANRCMGKVILDNILILKIEDIVKELNERFPLE